MGKVVSFPNKSINPRTQQTNIDPAVSKMIEKMDKKASKHVDNILVNEKMTDDEKFWYIYWLREISEILLVSSGKRK